MSFTFVGSGNDFIDELQELLVFDFSVEEVEVVFILDVVEHIDSVDIGLSHDRIQSHFVVVELPTVDH